MTFNFHSAWIINDDSISEDGVEAASWHQWSAEAAEADIILTAAQTNSSVSVVRIFRRQQTKWELVFSTGATNLEMLKYSIHDTTYRKIKECVAKNSRAPRRIRLTDAEVLMRGEVFLKAYWIDRMLKNFGQPIRRAIEAAQTSANPWQTVFDACIESFHLNYVLPTHFFLEAAEQAKKLNDAQGSVDQSYECVFACESQSPKASREIIARSAEARQFASEIGLNSDSLGQARSTLLERIVNQVKSPETAQRSVMFESRFRFPGAIQL